MNGLRTVLEFSADDCPVWRPVHDGVMGGLSRGAFHRTERGTGMFSGEISRANNGGFASIRAAVGPLDLSDCAGLAVRARGEGQTWQLRLRQHDDGDGVAWRALFTTVAGQWTETRLLFGDFSAVFRGRPVADAPPFDPRRLGQVGFLLSGVPAGPFTLEVAWVRAWSDSAASP